LPEFAFFGARIFERFINNSSLLLYRRSLLRISWMNNSGFISGYGFSHIASSRNQRGFPPLRSRHDSPRSKT
jgi:hypothetical protein